MKKINSILICQEFKYIDSFFKSFTGGLIKANHAYMARIENDTDVYIVLSESSTLPISTDSKNEIFIHIPLIGGQVKESRYSGRFCWLDINYLVENPLPEISNIDQLEYWISDEYTEEEESIDEIDYDSEIVYDMIKQRVDDVEKNSESSNEDINQMLEVVLDLIIDESPDLYRAIGESIIGVGGVFLNQPDMDYDRTLEELSKTIERYAEYGHEQDLFVAQYLLFSVINQSKKRRN